MPGWTITVDRMEGATFDPTIVCTIRLLWTESETDFNAAASRMLDNRVFEDGRDALAEWAQDLLAATIEHTARHEALRFISTGVRDAVTKQEAAEKDGDLAQAGQDYRQAMEPLQASGSEEEAQKEVAMNVTPEGHA